MATKDFINFNPNTGNKKETVSVTSIPNLGLDNMKKTSLSVQGKNISKDVNITSFANIIPTIVYQKYGVWYIEGCSGTIKLTNGVFISSFDKNPTAGSTYAKFGLLTPKGMGQELVSDKIIFIFRSNNAVNEIVTVDNINNQFDLITYQDSTQMIDLEIIEVAVFSKNLPRPQSIYKFGFNQSIS